MNAKQKLFCKEYLVDKNGAQAAIRAGYSKKTARQIATKLLSKAHIKEVIEGGLEKLSAKTDITAERVLSEIGKFAFSKENNFLKLEALGKLAKHFGILDAARFSHEKELANQSTQNNKDLIDALPKTIYYEYPEPPRNPAEETH